MIELKKLERRYLDGNGLVCEKTGMTFMNVTLPDGEVLESVEPHRLFPFADPTHYISLLDKEGNEKAVLRDLNALPAASLAVAEECLEGFYFVPKVLEVNNVEEKFGVIHFSVVTDRGPCTIDISYTIYQFRMLTPTRLLIRDNDSNRYEIPDIFALPKKSYDLLKKYL